MKYKRVISVVTLISLLILVGTSVNCSLSSTGGATDMMKKIPEGVSYFSFIDIKELRSDDDLKDIFEESEDDFDYWLEIGIDIDDIDSVAMYGSTILMDGDFNLDDIREELEDLDYDKDDYKGVEVWESDYGYTWVAMKGNLIIMGSEESVKDCIRVIDGGEDSVLDDNDCKDVMDRLPSGIFMMYNKIEEYQDMEAFGISIQTKDKDTLRVTEIFKFEDEDAAEDAIVEIEEYADEEDLYNINVDQDGKFVEVTASVDIEDFTWLNSTIL